MARKLSALEILLIIFIIIVLAVDILLLMLLLENPPGKGDACGCWIGRIEREVPQDAKDIFLFLHSSACHHIALFTVYSHN